MNYLTLQKRRILKKYEATASSYDDQYMEEQLDKFEAALNHSKLNLRSIVLDVGCGTGILAEKIANDVKFIIGVDFSKGMLEKAKSRLKSFQNASVICADADFLPFRDGLFTNVFAITLLQNMPNPASALSEIKRVAKAGAFVVVSGLKKNFTLSSFEKTLAESNLKQIAVNSRENIKDYVALLKS